MLELTRIELPSIVIKLSGIEIQLSLLEYLTVISLDKKYDNHINKSEKIYVISPQDGRIHEINKKTVKNYKAFPAFRSIEDAKIACSLIREHLKSIFSNA